MPRKLQCCLWSDALEVCEESARQIGEPVGLGCEKGLMAALPRWINRRCQKAKGTRTLSWRFAGGRWE